MPAAKEPGMFDNLFVEMGPMGSAMALFLVVLLPILLAAGATLSAARPFR